MAMRQETGGRGVTQGGEAIVRPAVDWGDDGPRPWLKVGSTRADPLYHKKHAVWRRYPGIPDICRPTNQPVFRFARVNNPSHRSVCRIEVSARFDPSVSYGIGGRTE